jgi:hypothetical protein
MESLMRAASSRLLLGIGLLIAATSSTTAGTAVSVPIDYAKVVSVAGTPSSIIVGNPTFADVSVQDGKLVLFGKAAGSTNIIVMDSDGNQLANFDVTVTSGGDNNLTIYKLGERLSAVCAPNCEYTPKVGDNPDVFKGLNDAISTRSGQATQAATAAGNN